MAKPTKTPPPIPSFSLRTAEGADDPDAIDLEAKMKKKATAKLTRLVDQHPDETLGALRRWMHED